MRSTVVAAIVAASVFVGPGVVRAGPRARVYAVSPEESRETTLEALAIAPTEAIGIGTSRLSVRSCADRGARRRVPALGLAAYAACTPEASAAADANGDFDARPAPAASSEHPDPFGEASAFHHGARLHAHVARALAVARARLGRDAGLTGEDFFLFRSPIDIVVRARGSRALFAPDDPTPDALVDLPIALYVPPDDPSALREHVVGAVAGEARGLILLGRHERTELAYDGDVVAHEVAHAVLDTGARIAGFRLDAIGASVEPDAIAEALADYLAAAAQAAATPNGVVGGSLGAIDPGRAPRNLNFVPTTAWGQTGDPYDDSLALSSRLWALRESLTADDAVLLDGLVALAGRREIRGIPADASFAELCDALSMVAARADEARLGPGMRAACAPLSVRARVVEMTPGIPFTSPLRSTLAPGTRSIARRLPLSEVEAIVVAPGLFQAHLPIPPGTRTLRGGVLRLPYRRRPWGASRGADGEYVALARFGAPIDWTSMPMPGVVRALPGATFEFDVPDGARDVYVQIASTFEDDTMFESLTVNVVSETTSPDTVSTPASGCAMTPVVDAGRDAGTLLSAISAAIAAALTLAQRRRRPQDAARATAPSAMKGAP